MVSGQFIGKFGTLIIKEIKEKLENLYLKPFWKAVYRDYTMWESGLII